MNGPWACCRVPRGSSAAVTPMCQGGAGVTGGARAAAATGLLVDAVQQQQQQQCRVLQQMMKGLFVKTVGECNVFCSLGFGLKSNVFLMG